MSSESPSPRLRFGRLPTGIVWLAWSGLAAYLCLPAFLWHFRYIRATSPGMLAPFVAVLVLAIAVLPVVWHVIRRKGLCRWEPAALGGMCVAIGLVCEPRGTLVALWLVAAAYAVGRFGLDRLNVRFSSPIASTAIATTGGLAILAYLLFFLGLTGLYHRWIFAALLAASLIVFHRQLRSQWNELRRISHRWGEVNELRSPLASLSVTAGAILAVCGSIVVLIPSSDFDSLKVHFALARQYVSQGGLVPIDAEIYSYYPQGVESLMALAYALGGQPAAQMAPAVFLVLALLAVFAIVRECGFGHLGALTGTLLVLAVPFIHRTGFNMKNDAAVGCYQLVGLLTFLAWRRTSNFRYVVLTVFFAAASSGVKLTALFGISALAMLCLYAVWKQQSRVRTTISLVFVFVVFGLIWQTRVWFLTGNPVYPHAVSDSVSGPGQKDVRDNSPRKIPISLRLPWVAHFKGHDVFRSFSRNPLGVAMIVFLPAWLLLRRRPGSLAERFCLVFALLYIVYWTQFWPVLRYGIAAAAVLFALLGARVAALVSMSSRWRSAPALAGVAFCLLFSLAVIMILEVNSLQLSLLAGRIDRADYLRQVLPTYASLEYLGQESGPGDAIFGVMNCSRAYAPDPGLFACGFAPPGSGLFRWIERTMSERRYRYLIMPAGGSYDPVLEKQAESNTARLVFTDRHFEVYELTPRP